MLAIVQPLSLSDVPPSIHSTNTKLCPVGFSSFWRSRTSATSTVVCRDHAEGCWWTFAVMIAWVESALILPCRVSSELSQMSSWCLHNGCSKIRTVERLSLCCQNILCGIDEHQIWALISWPYLSTLSRLTRHVAGVDRVRNWMTMTKSGQSDPGCQDMFFI